MRAAGGGRGGAASEKHDRLVERPEVRDLINVPSGAATTCLSAGVLLTVRASTKPGSSTPLLYSTQIRRWASPG